MSGTIHVKNERKGKSLVKGLTKKRERVKVDEDLKIKGGYKRLEKLESELKKVKAELRVVSSQSGKLYAFMERLATKSGCRDEFYAHMREKGK